MRDTSRFVFLIGPRGSGKTTVGRLVADSLNLPFHDTDDMLMAAVGLSIAEIVAEGGWAAFREEESRILKRALAEGAEAGAVIATGGGIVLAQENRECMRASGVVFYLSASAEHLHARLERNLDAQRRPSLTGDSPLLEISRILSEREPLYRQSAHHVLDAAAPCSRVASEIVDRVRRDAKELK